MVLKQVDLFLQGAASSQDERAAAAIHAVRLDNEMNGIAVQVRVSDSFQAVYYSRQW